MVELRAYTSAVLGSNPSVPIKSQIFRLFFYFHLKFFQPAHSMLHKRVSIVLLYDRYMDMGEGHKFIINKFFYIWTYQSTI